MTNKSRRWRVSCMVLPMAILFCGCAPLKVNQPSVFGKFSDNAKRLFQRSESTPANPADEHASTAKPTANSTGNLESKVLAEQLLTQSRSENLLRQMNHPLLPTANSDRVTLASPRVQAAVAYQHEIEKQTAYDLGRFDAMQAAYQQPMSRSYTNPGDLPDATNPDALAGHSPGYAPHDMTRDSYQGPGLGQNGFSNPGSPGENWKNQGGYIDENNFARTNRAFPQRADGLNNQMAVTSAGLSGSYNETQLRNPPPAPYMPNQSYSAGHFSGGMNFVGSELRRQVKTATELALDMQDVNEQLRAQLRMKDVELEQFAKKLNEKDQTLNDTQSLLGKSNRISVLLREKIAKLNVNVQDLEQENMAIERNADKALQEIELKLDGVLLDSISKTKR